MEKKLTKEEIGKLIPHRDPFLFLDELINIHRLETATGVKIFKNNEEFFKGHFPGHPIVPGVILIEMMAQTAAALIAYSAMILGYYVFKDFPDIWTFLGLFIIMTSGIYIFRREVKYKNI